MKLRNLFPKGRKDLFQAEHLFVLPMKIIILWEKQELPAEEKGVENENL